MAVTALSIPDHIIEAVRERTSLVDVVSETVSLRRSGKNFVGLCPFHSEKTPSFNVNDEEGFFRCFGCGEKGTVYNFLMKTRGYTFPEAVRYLAAKAGIR
ncbi:MAG TPA: CHC2 zinc finger domain-containing protein, partial [Oligoflexia bacterium]|nr:CHC2 zinc finger domain-containing protein [Oligoflexia bacterium]